MSEVIVDGEKPAKKTRKSRETTVKVSLPASHARAARDKRIMSFVRRSSENEVKLANPSDFFEKIATPVESRLYNWVKEVSLSAEEHLDTRGYSRIIEINPSTGKSRLQLVKTSKELREAIAKSEKCHDFFMRVREANYRKALIKEYGFDDDSTSGNSISSLQVRQEYTPLIGTPFFKQLYLFDYWEMHSKCFWYKNYSGIGKLIVDMTRNFVMGNGFNISFDDDKCQTAWNRYEDRSNIQEESRNWCDELTGFGENMLRKVRSSAAGLIHRSFDPSTIWEIVTDPENISDIKYYHQQYNTQYQLYGTKDAPTSKYIIDQIPPGEVIHTKVNVTSYEKRGRSDLLAPLLYFKYYEDYMQAKLSRAKNEAAFIWDVEIDGDDQDVRDYINNTQNIVDVPPGSENVHNKAIKRTPLSPQLSSRAGDQTAQDILSYVAMATSIPVNYMGTFGTGGYTKAGSLVATEPVAKKMMERQLKMEAMLRRIVKDVLIDAGINPADPKSAFEINFPEILAEDRSAKIQDTITAKDAQAISHETMSYIVAKELKITKYDYSKEQDKIKKESKNPLLMPIDMPDLTQDDPGGDDNGKRQFNRAKVKKDGLQV